MSESFDEPTITPRLQRPLAAVWISMGLHAALIALVQVAPQTSLNPGAQMIEARLVPVHTSTLAQDHAETKVKTAEVVPEKAPLLATSEKEKWVQVAGSVSPPPRMAPSAASPAAEVSGEPLPAPPTQVAPAPLGTITSAVDLTYYGAREVDVHPRALREVVPDYPPDAEQQHLSGKVRLQLKLEADGRVSDIAVVDETPVGSFRESAVKAFQAVRFSPAKKNGRPVRALVLIEVVYDYDARP